MNANGAVRRAPVFGPEPWSEVAGCTWSQWDLWFCTVAVSDYDHSLGQLESQLAAELRNRSGGREGTEVLQRTGFRVTTPTRSIIDIAATSPDEEQLGRVIAQARESGLLTLRSVRTRADAVDIRAALSIERAISASRTR